jgi:DNA-directed RNA polymerase subunit N (RpoN/RPB10)
MRLSKEAKERELSKLLLSLKLPRYCCQARMMSYKDLVHEILPIYQNK